MESLSRCRLSPTGATPRAASSVRPASGPGRPAIPSQWQPNPATTNPWPAPAWSRASKKAPRGTCPKLGRTHVTAPHDDASLAPSTSMPRSEFGGRHLHPLTASPPLRSSASSPARSPPPAQAAKRHQSLGSSGPTERAHPPSARRKQGRARLPPRPTKPSPLAASARPPRRDRGAGCANIPLPIGPTRQRERDGTGRAGRRLRTRSWSPHLPLPLPLPSRGGYKRPLRSVLSSLLSAPPTPALLHSICHPLPVPAPACVCSRDLV